MICRLTTHDGRNALLEDDLVWTVGYSRSTGQTPQGAVLERILNSVFTRELMPSSPADGVSGSRQAVEAAKFFRGKLKWFSEANPKAGVVY